MSTHTPHDPKPDEARAGPPAVLGRDILVERRAGTAIVTLNRPQRRNAVSLAMWQALGALFRDLATDDAVRAVVLTGAGGHFCAGADISEFGTLRNSVERGTAYERMVDDCEAAIAELPKPTIAAVAGFCVGGGCGLALACDFRFAEPAAKFAITAARLGIVYGLRETEYLYRTVGLAGAKRILFTGERLEAREALEIGLVDRLTEGPALPSAEAFAASLADNAPLSIAGAKHILHALAGNHADPHRIEALIRASLESADYREGVAAFNAKRRPRFTGR
jgi:enoyl-CoA hydratase/carnithine racemase